MSLQCINIVCYYSECVLASVLVPAGDWINLFKIQNNCSKEYLNSFVNSWPVCLHVVKLFFTNFLRKSNMSDPSLCTITVLISLTIMYIFFNDDFLHLGFADWYRCRQYFGIWSVASTIVVKITNRLRKNYENQGAKDLPLDILISDRQPYWLYRWRKE